MAGDNLKPGDLCVVLRPPNARFLSPLQEKIIGQTVTLVVIEKPPITFPTYAPYWTVKELPATGCPT
jgi:hypothetical protein